MDAGLIGAIIGVGMLATLGLCVKVRELYKQWLKKRTIQTTIPSQTSPLLLQRQHSKINMILPK